MMAIEDETDGYDDDDCEDTSIWSSFHTGFEPYPTLFDGDMTPRCNCCSVQNRHNPFTWILCRLGALDSTLYFSNFLGYGSLTRAWWDFSERFNICSFCNRLNLFRKVAYHSYHGSKADLGDRYEKSWCQFCWNARVGEGGCGYDSDLSVRTDRMRGSHPVEIGPSCGSED